MARSAFMVGHVLAEFAAAMLGLADHDRRRARRGLAHPHRRAARRRRLRAALLAAGLRTLFGNPTATPHDAAWPLQHPVASSFMWRAALLAVTVPLAIAAYRRRTEG